MDKFGGMTLHGSELASLEYSTDSAVTWHDVPGVMAYGENGGEAPTRFQIAFKSRAQKIGVPRVQGVGIAAYYAPAHPAWSKMQELGDSVELAWFRMTTKKDIVHSFAAMHEVAFGVKDSSGAGEATFTVTGSGDLVLPDLGSEDFEGGQVIKVQSGAYYRIDRVDHEAKKIFVRGDPYTGVVVPARDVVDIRVPATRRQFRAWVAQVDVVSLGIEDDMRSPLILAPKSRLPKWSILTD